MICPLLSIHLSLFLLILFPSFTSMSIDNGIIGVPQIDCGNNMISILFNTQKSFAGSVYAKGFYAKEECRVAGSNTASSVSMRVPVNFECGMRRKRVISPNRGLVLEAIVVIMFHPIFLTKIDRSFRIQCLYMEADKLVTERLDINTLPPTDLPGLVDDTKMPICQYEVLRGGPSGESVKYASIGEKVYHKWSCKGPQAELYCMTVHSCSADDGQGTGQLLIDEKGCTQDRFLLNNLAYIDDMTAGQEAHVFKFADHQTIFFQCQIRLELKEELGAICPRPSCSDSMIPSASHPVQLPGRKDILDENIQSKKQKSITQGTNALDKASNNHQSLSEYSSDDQVSGPKKTTNRYSQGIASVTAIGKNSYGRSQTVQSPKYGKRKDLGVGLKKDHLVVTSPSYGDEEIDDSSSSLEERGGYRHRRRRNWSDHDENLNYLLKNPIKEKRFQVDMDVMGSVEVLDAVPLESPLDSERLSLANQRARAFRKDKICLPRSIVMTSLLLGFFIFSIAIITFCVFHSKKRILTRKKVSVLVK